MREFHKRKSLTGLGLGLFPYRVTRRAPVKQVTSESVGVNDIIIAGVCVGTFPGTIC